MFGFGFGFSFSFSSGFWLYGSGNIPFALVHLNALPWLPYHTLSIQSLLYKSNDIMAANRAGQTLIP